MRHGRVARVVHLVTWCLGLVLQLPWARATLAGDLPEYKLKAAFLFNFARYTEWPAEVGGTLNFCVAGADPFGAELDALQGKAVGDRTIAVQRRRIDDGIKGCHLVYVGAATMPQLPRLLAGIGDSPVLTVADSPGAGRQGVALNMNVENDRVTFEANLHAARAAHLNLSSKLLRLATEVRQ